MKEPKLGHLYMNKGLTGLVMITQTGGSIVGFQYQSDGEFDFRSLEVFNAAFTDYDLYKLDVQFKADLAAILDES
jgi:hypothetical protein